MIIYYNISSNKSSPKTLIETLELQVSTQSINAKTHEIMSFLLSFENGGLCTLKEEVGQLSAKSMSG